MVGEMSVKALFFSLLAVTAVVGYLVFAYGIAYGSGDSGADMAADAVDVPGPRQTVRGSLATTADENYYRITVEEEKAGYVAVSIMENTKVKTRGYQFRLALFNDQGECVVRECELGNPFSQVRWLDEGVYYLRVTANTGMDLDGVSLAYKLKWAPSGSLNSAHDRCVAIATDAADPYYGCQSSLVNRQHPGEDINIEPVWDQGVYGDGVRVVVVDNGVDHAHEDLAGVVDVESSAAYEAGVPLYGTRTFHATLMAGIIAAQHNSIGVRGIAPDATLISYRVGSYAEHAATGLSHEHTTTAVSNNSWGVAFSFTPYSDPADGDAFNSITTGITDGFHGKGTAYIFAAANQYNSNFSPLEVFYGIVNVCGLDEDGTADIKTTYGANRWICAPVHTHSTSRGDTYMGIGGESAATAVVSGVVALIRGVNSELTWRDVKLLLAETARKNDSTNGEWRTGADKYGSDGTYNFSHLYGFGTVDATAAVSAARDWNLLPAMLTATHTGPGLDIPDYTGELQSSESTIAVEDGEGTPQFIEHVEIKIGWQHGSASDLSLQLVSPAGVVSDLIRPNDRLRYRDFEYITYSMAATGHLGESALGTWTLRVADHYEGGTGSIETWDLIIRGHRNVDTTDTETDWEAGMTVGIEDSYTPAVYGYSGIAELEGAALTPSAMTVDGHECDILTVALHAGSLYLGADCEISDEFVLEIDGASFDSADASNPPEIDMSSIHQWVASGLEWESGQQVSLSIEFREPADDEESEPVLPPLTAHFMMLPDGHNGAQEQPFTFRLHFSEDFSLSYKTLQDSALDVTGGTVKAAKRVVKGENRMWNITIMPAESDPVEISLPATTDCGDTGAICTQDGRMLSNAVTAVVPATGAPTISGTAQVRETLTANTSGIADKDGLTNATFSYQWQADDTDIGGATNASYTLTDSDEGKTVKVTVTFTDDAGNEESVTSAATAAVAPPPTPLTASIHDAPESHDGENSFTFELRFSETPEPDFSYEALRDHAFTATGGTVTNALPLDPPGNVRWEITVEPSSDADVTIVLPVTTDCDDQGAICTADGRMLSAEAALTVAGPEEEEEQTPPENNQATGAPAISGTAQVRETLTAGTSGIADPDGLSNASFSYQWIRNDGSADTDIQDATGSTYTLTSADEGKTVKVRVSFTDDGGNDETLTSDATGDVAAAPNRAATGTPTISGTVQVDETLTADTSGIADEDGLNNATFSYQWVAGGADIDGATGSSYTLADNDAGKTVQVRVSFTDDAGNQEYLTSAATGAVAATEPPLTVNLTAAAPASHDGSTAFTFEIRFSEEPAPDFSYKTLRDHAFTVAGGSVKTAQRLQKDPISNIGWRVTVEPGGNGDVTIVLPVTTDCDADGAVCTEDGRELSNSLNFTVSGPGG